MDDAKWIVVYQLSGHECYYVGDGVPWTTDITQAKWLTEADAESFWKTEREGSECWPLEWTFTADGLFVSQRCGGSGRVG